MSRPFQFSLRMLLVGITCLAAVCACVSHVRESYLVQLRAVESVLAEFPEIERVWLCTNNDVTLEVEGLWFSTVDAPNAVFGIEWGLAWTKPEIRKQLRQVLLERRPTKLPERATYSLR